MLVCGHCGNKTSGHWCDCGQPATTPAGLVTAPELAALTAEHQAWLEAP